MQNLIKKIEGFKSKNILVIGDLILDKYTIGDCDRISPEAPVPVLEVKEVKYSIGGAGNTAVNIKTLGSEPSLIGVVGRDQEGENFKKELKNKGIRHSKVLFSPYSKTVLKERVISLGQQLLRIDHIDKIVENKKHYEHILNKLSENFGTDIDVVVLSDYSKGTLSESLIKKIISLARVKNKLIIIDPRPQHISAYKNASFITPNFKEACDMTNIKYEFSLDNAKKLANSLYKILNSTVILTMAENGILFYNGKESKHFPTFKREVRDVAGAGDTVVAALSVGLANNLDIQEAIYFANHAGGVKVEKSMVQPVSLEEVIKDIKLHNEIKTESKNL